ncbi:hypothetical protein HAX54_045588 [Datura stramonium]|uniref:Uncharacterized protein n=1 Tax=Datura stramonium TaxID=4076 RepID=A0ABS8WFY2_DATST|nr:hypothetical protein [Datura stramonium]
MHRRVAPPFACGKQKSGEKKRKLATHRLNTGDNRRTAGSALTETSTPGSWSIIRDTNDGTPQNATTHRQPPLSAGQGRVDQWVGQALKINFLTSIGAGVVTADSYRHFACSNTGDLPICPVHCVQVTLYRYFAGYNLRFANEL